MPALAPTMRASAPAASGTGFKASAVLPRRNALPAALRPTLRRAAVRTPAAPAKAVIETLRTRDLQKDDELKKFRVVYDFERWATHRSSNRYLRHMVGLFQSRIVYNLRWPLVLIGLEASAIVAWEYARTHGLVDGDAPSVVIRAPIVFNLSSFALSLLLVFRTNSSYGRFDEARKLWGSMVNRSRDIMRQSTIFFGADQRELTQAFARWQAALPWVMKNHLREERTWEDDLLKSGILLPEEYEMLMASAHQPNTVLLALGSIAERAYLSGDQRFRMDQNLTVFADVVGACERLLRTPIPVSYTRHTSRFLVTWLAFMPFTIYDSCGWATIPSSVILSFFLLAIEEIGVCIEEPFYVLPLEAIAGTISTNVKQHVQQIDDVQALVSDVTATPVRIQERETVNA